ncbi:MAG: cellobiose phosphorylase [Firmicutes bacterium]|nr:cellobiose phosphorylase [Bacillota bacterium]
MYRIKNNESNLVLEVLKNGNIRKINADNKMVNQLIGTNLEPMVHNIYLRVKDTNGEILKYFPLIGSCANKGFSVNGNQVTYKGKAADMAYTVCVSLSDSAWFYDIFLQNYGASQIVDLVYTQDVGLATEGHVTNNEAYNSQYIDHKVFETPEGYVLCSRQNQVQMGGFPFLQQGSLGHCAAFSVDGFPFFGLEYKFDNKIGDLGKRKLNNRLYQYDFAYSALQSRDINLENVATFTFYGLFKSNLPTRITEPVSVQEIKKLHRKLTFAEPSVYENFPVEVDLTKTISSAPLSPEDIHSLYPTRFSEEFEGKDLLSFFTETGEHVVLMEKERHVERPHGHIIINFSDSPLGTMASTNWIYGVFASHVVLGNTSFNKLDTNCRNGLNVSKASGQRLMVKQDGAYKLLTMPAVYEMGFNYAKWLYKLGEDIIEIRSYIGADAKVLKLEVISHKGIAYDFLLYDVLERGVKITCSNGAIRAVYEESTMTANAYPNLAFEMSIDTPCKISDDSRFYPQMGSQGENLLALEISACSKFILKTSATLDGNIEAADINFHTEKELYRSKLSASILDFHLQHENQPVRKCNQLVLWFSHNARVHYASPHGLEQYTGAAWGTRDVCQGPFEYFLTTQNFDVCRKILETVYRHQYLENGNWPQWFMFDNYRNIQAGDSHGDIIVWPLKALASYLTATGDYGVLDEQIPYTHINGYNFTEETETLFAHAKRQINVIQQNFISGTFLSCYGGGDWDDTLQPANHELAKNMVSGWTVPLTYQTFKEFARAIQGYDNEFAENLMTLAGNIRADYNKYLIKDEIAAGFLLFEEGEIQCLLHPSDHKTGINYRLLPMIRGIISEMFTPQQAAKHYSLIKEHLYHPDGVRLMNTTVTYNGGENHYFMRAETAAAFAREVSLLYAHAHIRFVEAMAKLGSPDEVWQGLLKLNPIKLDETVPNAARRQSNVYFTSSEAAFENRYDAMENFDKIKAGEIAVKGGWRLYSSGPGIYLHQLVSKMLGLRIKQGDVILDPILPKALDGLVFSYKILGKPVKIHYHVTGNPVSKILLDGQEISFTQINEPYRNGGALFPAEIVEENSIIEVYC